MGPWQGKFLVSFGNAIFAFVLMVGLLVHSRVRNGHFVSLRNNLFFDQNGALRWRNVWLILITTGFNSIGTIFFVLAFELALYSGLNQGVINALFTLNALILALFSCAIFNERLSPLQIVSVFIMTLSPVLLSMANLEEGWMTDVDPETYISPAFTVLAGMGTVVFYGLRSIMIKYMARKGESAFTVSYWQLMLDGYIWTIIGVIYFILRNEAIDGEILLGMAGAGVIAGIGIVSLTISIA